MSKKDAIRVIVGDGSRVDRDLVRFMLERDGFRVISSVAASEDLNRAASVMRPDAVVLGEELLDLGGGQAARLARGACPEAKIVLFSALPAAAAVGPGEPDAVLERGIGLKDLTRSLNDLFQPAARGTVATLPIAAAGARASAAPTPASPPPPPLTDEPRRRPIVVLAAAAAAIVLLAFVVARNFPPDEPSVRSSGVPSSGVPSTAPTSDPTGAPTDAGVAGGAAPASNAGQQRLDEAKSYLDRLEQAVQAGRLGEVSSLAHRLAHAHTLAAAAGADVSDLSVLIQDTLAGLTDELNPLLGAALRGALGRLAPPPTTPGSGPSTGHPSDGQPRPDPATSPPPIDEADETTAPPDEGVTPVDPPEDGSSTDEPEPESSPIDGAGGGFDQGVANDGQADGDSRSSDSTEERDADVTLSHPADPDPAGNPEGGGGHGDEPGSDAPIASTGPSGSSDDDGEATPDAPDDSPDDSADDGDGDAAAGR